MTQEETKKLAEKTLERSKDLIKYDLIRTVCGRYDMGEFGDDPEISAPSVVSLICGLVSDDAKRASRAMSALGVERLLARATFERVETFGQKKKGNGCK